MSKHEGQKKARDTDRPSSDLTTSEKGPNEKLHEHDMFEADTLVPGTQKPESEEIKDEKGPNTE
jgi:hypothetical protein